MRSKKLSLSAIALASALTLSTQSGCQEVEEPITVLTQEQWTEVKKHLLEEEPSPKHKVGAVFNDEIELIGFDVEQPLVAGKPATFVWYWKALKDINQNWQIFVHLDSKAESFRQNLDHQPMNGLYQTGRWKKGQIIKDIQKVTIRDNYPNGEAVPYIGLFRGDTRMAIKNDVKKTNDNRVIGATLTVKGDPAVLKKQNEKLTYTLPLATAELSDAVKIDGKLDETVWNRTPVINLSPMGNAPPLDTTVKAFWTGTHLFLGATLTDTHIWGTLKERDDSLWNEEVFEIFIAPEGPGGEYVELQISPLGTIFDAYFKQRLGKGEGTRQEQIDRARAWNLEGLEVAVHVDGTVNDKSKEDQSWTIELKIPLDSLPAMKSKPTSETAWSVNLYRFDRPETNVSHAYGWSTKPRGDFHRIEEFGTFRFAQSSPQVSGREIPPKTLKLIQQHSKDIKPRQPAETEAPTP